MNSIQLTGWFCPSALNFTDNYEDFLYKPKKPHYGFKSWHEWFLRKFRKGVRKVGVGSPKGIRDQNIIVHSCQSSTISNPIQPVKGVKASDEFWLKDNRYSLNDMFGKRGLSKKYGSLFVGGTIYLPSLFERHELPSMAFACRWQNSRCLQNSRHLLLRPVSI